MLTRALNTAGRSLKVGARVELHPGTDAWMQGDRYGAVAIIGHKYVHVKMDRSGLTRRVHEDNLTPL